MIDICEFYNRLKERGIEFITGVPDSLLNDFCSHIQENWEPDRHVIAANEGNAVALAAGYHLATGTVPLVYMQNSGMGISLNPLLSLTNKEVYSIPMILLIGWRGDPSDKDHVQHQKQGELTPVLLENADIPFKILDDGEEACLSAVDWAVKEAGRRSAPVALVVKKGVLSKAKKIEPERGGAAGVLSREEAMEILMRTLPRESVYVATTGRATRELYALGEKLGRGHNGDFLNVGAMGHASSIAAGIALGARNRPVVCLDGDAALIMHLGSLTTTGKTNLPHLIHVMLNNGVHESVGGQPSAGYVADFTAIAREAGFRTLEGAVDSEKEIIEAVGRLVPSDKPVFLEIRIRPGIRDDLAPLKIDHHQLKINLMNYLKENN